MHLVAHPIATGILKRRLGDRKVSKGQLFEEMRPKAKGDDLYELVGELWGGTWTALPACLPPLCPTLRGTRSRPSWATSKASRTMR